MDLLWYKYSDFCRYSEAIRLPAAVLLPGTLHTPLPPTERRCTGDLCALDTKSQNRLGGLSGLKACPLFVQDQTHGPELHWGGAWVHWINTHRRNRAVGWCSVVLWVDFYTVIA